MPLFDRDSAGGHVSSNVALVSKVGTVSVTTLQDTTTQSLVIGRNTYWRHALDVGSDYEGPVMRCYSAFARWPLPFLIEQRLFEVLGLPTQSIDEWRRKYAPEDRAS